MNVADSHFSVHRDTDSVSSWHCRNDEDDDERPPLEMRMISYSYHIPILGSVPSPILGTRKGTCFCEKKLNAVPKETFNSSKLN